jgi:hypothetical protein
MAERELTAQEHQIVEQGIQAGVLLSDPAFKSVIQSLMFESWAQWTESKPEAKDRREDNYNFYRGLKAIEAELNARVQAKDEIERVMNEDRDDADEDEDDEA